MHSNKAAVNKVGFINFYIKCITENQNTQHLHSDALRAHSCSCFLTWFHLEGFPVPLCSWWYILSTEDTLSSTPVLWRVCATQTALTGKKGMKSRSCKSVKCLRASSLNLVPPDIKASICTCLWGVWGSDFPHPSVKCWMHLHHPGKHRRKTIYV